MQATELIANEVAKVLSENEIYQSYKNRWRYLLESYIGGDEYKRAGHLVRYVNETKEEYNARLRSTPLDNHCNSIVSVYTSFLFREEPYRDLVNISNSPFYNDFVRDCDYEGRTLDHFMKDVSVWASVFGHAWIIVSKPDVGATTAAEEMAVGNRPYLSMLTPLVVVDWEWSRMSTGEYELTYFKYIEDINDDVYTVKEWTPELIKTSVVDSVKRSYVKTPTVENNALGMIPAVLCYNKRSSVRGVGISDITDIADQQKFIYNAKSEVEQSIRLNTHPSLVKTENTQAGIGAGSIIQLDESTDPGLKPYLLEFNGASISSIYQSIEQAENMIDKLANTGAVRQTVSKQLSGIAMETEFQLLNSRLADKAHSIELAEEQMWQIWAKYMNLNYEGVIEYPMSFNIRDAARDLEFYMNAMTMNVPSETYKKEVYKIIADLSIGDSEAFSQIKDEIENSASGTFEMPEMEMEVNEEFKPHIMANQEGDMVIAKSPEDHETLVAQGYVEI